MNLPPSAPAFLGVTESLTGRSWEGPDPDRARMTEALAQDTGLPRAVCAVLAARGIDAAGTEAFLAPALRDLLPDPLVLRDMDRAAGRILAALRGRQKIAVFADYDVDGGASAALLLVWLRDLGAGATLYVPDRIDEGYGPNETAMAELARTHDLIICVDCGTLSFDAIAAARGADVVVLDHHLAAETLPDAVAVVNPNRQDETGDLAHLCAAAVVFLVLVEMNRQLRGAGVTGPNLLSYLDLVGLATVADVAPLIGVNRALVRQGLKVMAARQRPGLVALADVAQMNAAPTAYTLGFVFGPRINAGGRIGRADLGARLLSTQDPTEAKTLAAELDRYNTERREIENRVREAALAQADMRGIEAPLVWAADDGWHPGVVGIVAARLKEATNRPAVVIGFDGDAGKGSGRSVAGVDLGAAVHQLASEGLLQKGGGHKMAAGLSLSRDQLDPAMARLSDLLAKQGAGAQGPRVLRINSILMPSAATVEMIEQIDAAGPFGASAPAPRFAFPEVKIGFAKKVGEQHLKLSLNDGVGTRLDAIAFGAFDTDLGPRLMAHNGAAFHIVGRLEVNHWQGRARAQLRLEDAAPAE